MNRDWLERRPLVWLTIITLLFFWKLVFGGQFTFLNSPDLAYQVLPWYQLQARAWNSGVFPLWDPYQWAGQPLLGQMQPGAAFPLNWPLFLAPLEDGLIQLQFIHWHYVLMHLLAALFMYGLARQLGRSRYASLLAGLAFTTAGHVGHLAWPQMLNGVIWTPLVFLLLHRVVEAGWGLRAFSYAALGGAAIGMALLSGHHQAPIFMLLALTGLFFYFWLPKTRESKAGATRFASLYVFMAFVALLVSALQLIPAVEYGQAAYRWVGGPQPVTLGERVPYFVQEGLRLYPVSLLGTIIPRMHFEANTFIGVFCFSMALYALACCWADRWVRVYGSLAVAGIAYSFGPFSILHGWVYTFIPFADKARAAGHSVFVYQLALLLLAAHGIDHLFQAAKSDAVSQRRLSYIQRGLVLFGFLTIALLFHAAINGNMGASGDFVMLAALTALLLAALLHAYRQGLLSAPAARTAFLLLMVFELYSPDWFHTLDRRNPEGPEYLAKLEELRPAMSFLKSQPGEFRFEIRAEDFRANIGALEGVEAVDGYLASVSKDLFDFFDEDWGERRLMMNTVYTLSKEKVRPEQVEVYSDSNGWKIFRNPDAYPRAWVVHGLRNISLPAGATGELPQPEACEGGEVLFERRTMHSNRLSVRLPCRSYVVFADAYFPGWQALLDGKPMPLYRAHGALRAVAAPAGDHTIEIVYRPRSVQLGAALTVIGFVGCGVLAGFAWRRRELP